MATPTCGAMGAALLAAGAKNFPDAALNLGGDYTAMTRFETVGGGPAATAAAAIAEAIQRGALRNLTIAPKLAIGLLAIPAAQHLIADVTYYTPSLLPKLAPLYNEDRRVIDFLLGGSITQPWISADQGKHLLDLKKMISLWNTRNSHKP